MQHDLYQQVAEATRSLYDVRAELGHAPHLGTAYLAQDVAHGGTAVLLVPPGADALDVVPALSDAVPAGGGRCTSCGRALVTWSDVCPQCGRSLTPSPGEELEVGTVAAAAGGALDVVGVVPHARGGQIFFGQDRVDRRLVAFAARPQGDGRFWLDALWEADAASVPAPAGSRWGSDEPGVDSGPTDTAALGIATPSLARLEAAAYTTDVGSSASDVPRGESTAGRGRRGLLFAVGGGVLVAIGAVAWALTRGGNGAAAPGGTLQAVTTAHAGSVAPAGGTIPVTGAVSGTSTAADSQPGAIAAQGTQAVAVSRADSLRLAQNARRRRLAAERARAAAAFGDSAVLTIAGDLPSGWVALVNAGGAAGGRTISLPPGVASVVVIEAPGYCPDTLRVAPGAGGRHEWSPVLRSRPTVGSC